MVVVVMVETSTVRRNCCPRGSWRSTQLLLNRRTMALNGIAHTVRSQTTASRNANRGTRRRFVIDCGLSNFVNCTLGSKVRRLGTRLIDSRHSVQPGRLEEMADVRAMCGPAELCAPRRQCDRQPTIHFRRMTMVSTAGAGRTEPSARPATAGLRLTVSMGKENDQRTFAPEP